MYQQNICWYSDYMPNIHPAVAQRRKTRCANSACSTLPWQLAAVGVITDQWQLI
jgi:hypothetical protein